MNRKADKENDHEVHETTCSHGPKPENQIDLGWHATCHGAVAKAKLLDPQADGCFYCSPACHTS